MSSEKEQKSHFIFLNITVAVWTTVMFVLFPACSRGEKNLAEAITERDSLPSMKTLGVTTLISDSGITRYKIITEEWEIYDKKNPPYWAFEKGVYLEKFDSLFHIDAMQVSPLHFPQLSQTYLLASYKSPPKKNK